MSLVWEYNEGQLKQTASGRLLLLERMINYGPRNGEKISLRQVKQHWDKLNLFPKNKKLMEFLIWGTTPLSDTSKRRF